MIIIPPPLRKSRGRPIERRSAVAALTLVAVEDVTAVGSELEAVLRFDTTAADPLASVAGASAAKWTARFNGNGYVGQSIENQAFDTLFLILTATGPNAGADEIRYAAGPSDIEDSLGRKLGAVSGMPI